MTVISIQVRPFESLLSFGNEYEYLVLPIHLIIWWTILIEYKVVWIITISLDWNFGKWKWLEINSFFHSLQNLAFLLLFPFFFWFSLVIIRYFSTLDFLHKIVENFIYILPCLCRSFNIRNLQKLKLKKRNIW